jgi:hypothetical protein
MMAALASEFVNCGPAQEEKKFGSPRESSMFKERVEAPPPPLPPDACLGMDPRVPLACGAAVVMVPPSNLGSVVCTRTHSRRTKGFNFNAIARIN